MPRAGACIRWLLTLLSLGGSLALGGIYAFRPPLADALTIWPLWLVMLPVIFVGLASLSRKTAARNLLLILVWLFVLGGLTEEPRSVVRGLWLRQDGAGEILRRREQMLRVVSLNCAAGSPEAAREAFACAPDLVLLQEAPGGAELEALCREHGDWQATVTEDCAILVRGRLEALSVRPEDAATLCLARVWPQVLRSERSLLVESVHLSLPVLRPALWRAATWREARAQWEHRRRQMQRVLAYVAQAACGEPVVVGGDFNTPGGDGLFRPLRPYLRDVFSEAAAGWPNTITNALPFARIDQVWVSSALRATRLRALRTEHSDHRMVVCDLVLK